MTGAHLFYIPILLLVGFFGGFFAGKRASEQERVQAIRREKRREALKEKRQVEGSASE